MKLKMLLVISYLSLWGVFCLVGWLKSVDRKEFWFAFFMGSMGFYALTAAFLGRAIRCGPLKISSPKVDPSNKYGYWTVVFIGVIQIFVGVWFLGKLIA